MSVYRRKDTKSRRFFYKFTIRGITYKRNIPTARTLRQAEEAERKARDEVHQGIYGTHEDMLFTDFVEKHYEPWAEQHHKNKLNDRTFRRLLCKHFKGLTLGRISRFTVDGFKLKLARTESMRKAPYKPTTINLALAYLSVILNLAVQYKKLRENPVRQVRRLPVEERRPRHLSREEEQVLLPALEQQGEYMRPLVEMAIWTGFRRIELLKLKRQHIDFQSNLIFVPDAKWRRDKRKTEGNPMSQQVRTLALRLCAGKGEYLFSTRDGKAATEMMVERRFKRACGSVGITDLTFHALRHTFGTRLGERDVNLKKIARLMGHSTTRMTEIYVHATDSGLLGAMEIAASEAQVRTGQAEIGIAESA